MRIDETFGYTYPRILRVRRRGPDSAVTIALLPGQTPKDVADHVPGIAHTWRVSRVATSSPGRGVGVLRVCFDKSWSGSASVP
ncbi:hypothetical protein [Embleya sp. AB8]|uniref:hypothetical protein n=1 Tax=Embleya sp. AB8 TaxID=3156304 RepID=UPI003C75D8BB